MVDENFMKVLKKIYDRLEGTKVNWAVTGSLGFALQGMPIEVHDIDIQTDKDGAYQIEELFKEHLVKKVVFSSAGKIRSHFGALEISGIKVEIMGDIQKYVDGEWEEPVDPGKYKKIVEAEGMLIPVLPLEYEYRAYMKLGRYEKANRIKMWLDDTLAVPKHIVAVVGLISNREGKILLKKDPFRGWEFPGGKVEEGEDLIEALKREVKEETGADVSIGRLAAIYSNTRAPAGIIFAFLGDYILGQLSAGNESLEVGWFDRQEVTNLISHRVIRDRARDLLEYSGKVIYRVYDTRMVIPSAPYRIQKEYQL